VPDDILRLANACSNISSVKAGHAFIEQDDTPTHVFILLEGWACYQRVTEDGNRQILDLAMPGSILGLSNESCARYGIEAKTNCRALAMPQEEFRKVLMQSPDLCVKCIDAFASSESRAFGRIVQVGWSHAPERIAGLIVELALRFGPSNSNEPIVVDLPLTQHDVADMLGLAHETVCRVLVSMREKKLATWRNGQLKIQNFDRLVAMTQGLHETGTVWTHGCKESAITCCAA
jgi:CRP-like cAMP-binding protein